jgi:hypothetical protein
VLGPVQDRAQGPRRVRLRHFLEEDEPLPRPLVEHHPALRGPRQGLVDRVDRNHRGVGHLVGQCRQLLQPIEPVEEGREHVHRLRLRQLLREPEGLPGPLVEHDAPLGGARELVVQHVGAGLEGMRHLVLQPIEQIHRPFDCVEAVEQMHQCLAGLGVL